MTTEPIGGGRPARRRDASRRATWARCRWAPVPARRYARSPVIGGRVVPPRNPQIGRAPSELQSLMRNSYAVFCLKKKKQTINREQIASQKKENNRTHKKT